MTLGKAGARISRHLPDLVNLFDPEVIFVGGEAVQFGGATSSRRSAYPSPALGDGRVMSRCLTEAGRKACR
jgi:predicted NBD/HSP70 family sugar kinase